MKKLLLISLLIGALPLGMLAQDDLYFVPKKKNVEKVNDNYGLPRDTYYSGSDRSVDDYNRRSSYYEQIDSTMSDVIDFNGELGVFPDSLATEDYQLTKKMSRFDDYDVSNNAAFWAGYNAGRYDWAWHSPWYYGRYGWYGWYDPWYYRPWYGGWYDPWYYSSWYGGWYDPWFYGWHDPYYYHRFYYYGGGGGRHYAYRNGNTGTINRYTSSRGGYNRGVSALGTGRSGSLRDRTIGSHRAYGSSGTRTSGDSGYSRSSSSRSSSGSFGGSTRSSGSFGGGGSTRSGGGFSGGGGGSRGGGGGGSHGGRR